MNKVEISIKRENMKRNQKEILLKSTINETKNSLELLGSRFEQAEESVNLKLEQ